MQQEPGVAGVAHAIQLSVAPVFLLSGIAAMLAVMTGRLGRIVDRARGLRGEAHDSDGETPAELHEEMAALSRRAKFIGGAITLCTVTALLIATVIAVLFVAAFLDRDFSTIVAGLFIAAMATLIAALLLFLREVLVATATRRIELQRRL